MRAIRAVFFSFCQSVGEVFPRDIW